MPVPTTHGPASKPLRSANGAKQTSSAHQPQSHEAVGLDKKAEERHYYLSADAYFCMTDGHYVFLDLRQNRYLCLTQQHSLEIQPVLAAEFPGYGLSDTGRMVLRTLEQAGLVVTDPGLGQPLPPPRLVPPAASLMLGNRKSFPIVSAAEIWRFTSAAISASISLRSRSMLWTVHKVAGRAPTEQLGHEMTDEQMIRELFCKFQKLRPLYPRSYLCLFDSLALLNFLAPYGAFPNWVYGVKLKPFAAHCWVQHAGLVVNDVVERVRDYTPIMRL
jgi:hypothetical protein